MMTTTRYIETVKMQKYEVIKDHNFAKGCIVQGQPLYNRLRVLVSNGKFVDFYMTIPMDVLKEVK